MPVGATVAVAGAGLASGVMGSSAAKSAAKTQSAAADRAADLQNQQFQQLLQLQMPGYQRGEQAASVYMQALGLPSMTGGASPAPSYATPASPAGYGGSMPTDIRDRGYSPSMTGGRITYQQDMPESFGDGYASPVAGTAQYGAATPTPATAPLSIADQVMQTPGYQTQLDQGLKSIDRAAPLTGGMYSGRRMKALNEFGQNTFGSYYQDWMNRVGGVAGQGAQTAQNVGQQGMENAKSVGGLMMTGANATAQGKLNSANAWSGAMSDAVGAGMWLGGQQGWFKK